MNIYEELLNNFSESVFEFCITNNNKGFGYIPLDGKVIKIENSYVLRTNSLQEKKDKYDDFMLCSIEEGGREYALMYKDPQHLYSNLLIKGEYYDILVIYSKKPDSEAVKELDRLTFIEYLKFMNIESEDDFIRNVRRCMAVYNRNNPNKNKTLDEVLKGK